MSALSSPAVITRTSRTVSPLGEPQMEQYPKNKLLRMLALLFQVSSCTRNKTQQEVLHLLEEGPGLHQNEPSDDVEQGATGETAQAERQVPIFPKLDSDVPSCSYWSDFLFYLYNNHTLLAMGWSHPYHPFSRSERWIVFFCSISLSFLLTAVQVFMDRYLPSFFSGTYTMVTVPVIMFLWENSLHFCSTCDHMCSSALSKCRPHDSDAPHGFVSAVIINLLRLMGKVMLWMAVANSIVFVALGILFIQLAKSHHVVEHFYRTWMFNQISANTWSVLYMFGYFAAITVWKNRKSIHSKIKNRG